MRRARSLEKNNVGLHQVKNDMFDEWFPLQLHNSPASVLRVHHWLINHNNLFLYDLFLLCCDIKT